jgi:serine dehydrogenase proteinase
MEIRKHPLLVLFYPSHASIEERYIRFLHGHLVKDGSLKKSQPLDELDVLLHTAGGDPSSAYRMAQVIYDFTKNANFLVPAYAYSAGTLMCLSAKKILLGDSAVLSPIDITLVPYIDKPEGQSGSDMFPDEEINLSEVELVSIDYFIQVAKHARIEIEAGFRQRGWRHSKTDVESTLLCEMTRQLGVLNVAKYYREKNITQEYAKVLLAGYMFATSDDSSERTQN